MVVNLYDFLAFSALLNIFVFGLFSFVIILKNPKEHLNRLFFLMCFASIFWSLGYWQWMISMKINDFIKSLIWARILSLSSLFIPLFYFHFVLVLLDLIKNKKFQIFMGLVYAITFFISLFSFSEFFVKTVEQKGPFSFWPTPGPLYSFYIFFIYFGVILYSLYLLISKHRKSLILEEKSRIKLVLLGSILGFGSGAFNFPLWFNIQIIPYPILYLWFLLLLLFLRLFLYHLFSA